MDEIIEVKEGDLNIEMGIQILPETNEDEPDLMSEEEKADFIKNTTILWLKDDVKLDKDDPKVDRLFQFVYDKQDGSHRLIVRKATKETEGVYTCLVENDSGTSSCSTQLIVGPGNLPKLTSGLEDVTVYVGQRLEFRVRSSGLPPIDKCQWFKDGELVVECRSSCLDEQIRSSVNSRISIIAEKTTSTKSNSSEQQLLFRFAIESLKLDDAGQYKCRVINEFGYDETECHVRVLQEVIEEHEEVEEQIEETMRLGGGESREEEQTTTTTTVEQEEREQEEERSVKRVKQEGQAPSFRRQLQDRTIVTTSKKSSRQFDEESEQGEELVVSTDWNEWCDSESKLKIRWFMNDIEIVSTSSSSEYQVDNFCRKLAGSEIQHRLKLNNRKSTRRSSVLGNSASNKFSCVASNQFGKTETSCIVRRLGEPKFLRSLEDVETQTDKTISMQVALDISDESNLAEEVQFWKDEQLVYSSKRDGDSLSSQWNNDTKSRVVVRSYEKTVETETLEEGELGADSSSWRRRSSLASSQSRRQARVYELTIERVQVDQAGTWLCRAKNEAGERECRAELEVYTEPKLITDLPDQVRVEPRREIKLQVEASGVPRPVFSWFKDGSGIAEEENRVFTETTTKTTTTTSSTTRTTSSAVKSRRSSVSSLRLSEDGTDIIGETLIIRDARPEDAGLYKCRIENRLGECETRDCKLTIAGHGDDLRGPPKIVKDLSQSSLFEVDEGENIILRVLADGQPKPSGHWMKDEREIETTSTSSGQKTGAGSRRSSRLESESVGQEYELKIKRTRESDSGNYKLKLRNEFGEVETRTVTVVVRKRTSVAGEEAPSIRMDSQDKVVGLDSTVSFDLEVAGQPKPFVTWFKNGRRLTESADGRVSFVEEEMTTTKTVIRETEVSSSADTKEKTVTVHRLIIRNVRDSDEAIYSLKAENDLGSCKSSLVSLTVDKRKAATDEVREREEAQQAERSKAKSSVSATEETTTTTVTTTTTETTSGEELESKMCVDEELQQDQEMLSEEERLSRDRLKAKTKTTRTTTTTTTTTKEEEEEEELEGREVEQETETEESRQDEEVRRQRELEKRREAEKTRTKRKTTTTSTKTDREEEEDDEEQERMEVDEETTEETEEIIEELEEEMNRQRQKRQKQRHQGREQADEELEVEERERTDTTRTKTREVEETDRRSKKPEILNSTQSVSAPLGAPVKLVVDVERNEETVVEWLKDGRQLSSRDLASGHLQTKTEETETVEEQEVTRHTLEVDEMKPTDEATYQAIVKNPQGQVESQPIVLKVDRKMSPGEPAKVVMTKPDLMKADLDQIAPQILSVPDEVVAGVGSSPQIRAVVEGKPEPEITWLKDGQKISQSDIDSGHIEIVDVPTSKPDTVIKALKINDLKPVDAGAYHVLAENPQGDAESEPTNLRIDRSMKPTDEPRVTPEQPADDVTKPEILNCSKEVSAGPGAPAKLVVDVSGKDATVEWLKDGKPLTDREIASGHLEPKTENTPENLADKPDQTRHTLEIDRMKPTDEATYQAVVKNPKGTTESQPMEVKLDRGMSPREPAKVVMSNPEIFKSDSELLLPKISSIPVEIVSGVGSSPQIEAVVQGKPEPEITWLKDGEKIRQREFDLGHLEIVDVPTDKPDTVIKALKINDLKPADAGSYQVRAENPLGVAESEPTKLKVDRTMRPSEEPQVTKREPSSLEKTSPDLMHADVDQIAPQILSVPDEIVAGVGSSPQVQAVISGKPEPEVTWLKDGQPIRQRDIDSGHVELVDLPTDKPDTVIKALKINDLKPIDAGAYHVRAENPLGEAESEPTNLRVDRSMGPREEPRVVGGELVKSKPDLMDSSVEQLSPQILSVPDEIVAGVGSSPQVEAVIAGKPEPEVTWLKDGQPIRQRDLDSGHIELVDLPTDKPDTVIKALKINDAKPIDAGAYQVRAENPLGQAESEPTNLRVDRSMGPNDEPKITKKEDGTLVPSKFDAMSADVEQLAPQILSVPDEVVAGVGSSPKIQAVISGKPEPEISWMKDGQPIKQADINSGHVELVDIPTDKPDTVIKALKINDVKPSDVGAYHVHAENPLGQADSEPTNLRIDRSMGPNDEPKVTPEDSVQEPAPSKSSKPEIVNCTKEVTAGPNSPAKLVVDVQGAGATVDWLKDGRPLSTRDLSSGHLEPKSEDISTPEKPNLVRHTLEVDNLKPTDQATYKAIAKNPIGEAESEPMTLKLDRKMSSVEDAKVVLSRPDLMDSSSDQVAPKILSIPSEIVSGPGSSPQIEAVVSGKPEPVATWFKDGKPISERDLNSGHVELIDLPTDKPDTRAIALKINDLKATDAAAYSVKLENPLGEATSEPTKLKVDRTMRPSQEPQVTKMEPWSLEKTSPDLMSADVDQIAPQILSVPDEVVAGVGSSPQIEAVISGKPEPEVTWLKDGQPIRQADINSGHIEFVDLPTDKPDTVIKALKINDLKPVDVAAYHVRAENPLGEAESEPTNVRIDRSMGPDDSPKITPETPLDSKSMPETIRPQIINSTKEVSAPLGSPAQLVVDVLAQPLATVEWLKNGQPLSDRDMARANLVPRSEKLPGGDKPEIVRHILATDKLRAGDEATYKAVAKNPLGTTQTEPMKLRVISESSPEKPEVVMSKPDLMGSTVEQIAPKILNVPEEIVAGTGSSPQIQAVISGKPEPEVTWFKDGTPISQRDLNSGHIEIVDVPTEKPDTVVKALKINNMKPTDVAAYHVHAENPLGEAESEPTNVRLDRSMGPRDEPIVTPESIPTKDSPSKKPVIVNCTKEVAAGPNAPAKLIVDVQGPDANVEWLKDGQPLSSRDIASGHLEPKSEDISTPEKPNLVRHTLEVDNVKPTDQATYKAIAKNPVGEAESEPMNLKLDRKMSSAEPAKVVMTKPDSMDQSIEQLAPKILSVPEEVVAGVGSSPQIQAVVSGKPEPEITWLKDGQPISKSDLKSGHIEIVDLPTDKPDTKAQVLKINNLKPADVAAYHVVAENPLGQAESEPTNLRLDRSMGPNDSPIVKPEDSSPSLLANKPEILDSSKDKSAKPGQQTKLFVDVTAHPAATVEWLKDGRPLTSRDLASGHLKPVSEKMPSPAGKPEVVRHTLEVDAMKPTDAATYQAVAKNPLGEAQSEPMNLKLVSDSSPEEPAQVESTQPELMEASRDQFAPQILSVPEEIVAGAGSSPQIQAAVSGKPEPEIQWFKDGQPIDQADLNSGHVEIVDVPSDTPNSKVQALKINNLKPMDAAAYHVRAENPLGCAESEPTNLRLDRSMAPTDKPLVTPETLVDGSGPKADSRKPKIINFTKKVPASQGEPAKLSVDVSANPDAEVQWLKNGRPISKQDIESGHLKPTTEKLEPDVTRYILEVDRVRPNDEATYQAVAKNPVGQAESEPMTLSLDTKSSPEEESAQSVESKPDSSLAASDQIAPKILSVPDEIVAGAGSSPQIQAVISGKPEPEVTWFKDGTPISQRDLNSGHIEIVDVPTEKPDTVVKALKINNMKPTDVAAYHVRAENPLGDAVSEPTNVRLDRSMGPNDSPKVSPSDSTTESAVPTTDSFKPEIVNSTKMVSGKPGSPAKLVVEVLARPDAHVEWLKNGRPLSAQDLASGHLAPKSEKLAAGEKPDVTRHILQVDQLKPSDEATYQAIAKNPVGQAESEPMKLKLDEKSSPAKSDQFAPRIVRVPEEVVAGVGSSPQIEAVVTGKPEPEVTWFKDGQPISQADLNSGHIEIVDVPTDKPDTVIQALKINNLKPVDAAAYHVRAENPLGDAESEPTNLRLDRSMAPTDEARVTPEEAAATLAPSESGDQPSGRKLRKPVISKLPRNIKLPLDAKAVIEVEISGGQPDKVEWFKDGKVVKPTKDARVTMESLPDGTQRLTIDHLRPEDEGVYTLQASNPAGSDKSGPISLAIDTEAKPGDQPGESPKKQMRAPRIKRMPRRIVAGVGSNPVIEIEVSGEPKPEIVWFKNGRRVHSVKNHIAMVDCGNGIFQLQFSDVKVVDQAEYSFIATNDVGKIESEPISLIVDRGMSSTAEPFVQEETNLPNDETEQIFDGPIEAPKIFGLDDKETLPGQTVKLEAEVTGSPKPQIKWLKDGDEVELNILNENPDSNKHSLTLKNVNDLYDGVYSLEATNLAGTARKDAVVRVVDTLTQKPDRVEAAPAKPEPVEPAKRKPSVEHGEKPFIKRGLKFSQVNQGRSIKFEVQIDGPYDELIWMKDGKQINLTEDGSPEGPMDADEDDNLTLVGENTDDVGVAEMDELDDDFSGRPSDAKRRVGPRILIRPRNVLAGPGSRIALECKVSGEPKPEIIWFKNGQRIVVTSENEAKVNIQEETETVEEQTSTTVKEDQYWSRLIIENLDEQDVGSYEVLVQNPYGSERSPAVQVDLDREMCATDDLATDELPSSSPLKRGRGPRILAQPRNVRAPKGSKIAFEVQVSGEPRPIVNWFRDGRLVSETADGHVTIREYSNGVVRLVIDNIAPADEGQFEARAENKLGSVRTIPVTLTVDDDGTAPSDFVGAEPTDETLGKPSGARPPRILLRPKLAKGRPGDKLELEVSVTGQSKPSIVWYKDGKRIEAKTVLNSDGTSQTQTTSSSERVEIHKVSDSYEKLVIHNLESSDSGKYTVSAENLFGVSMSEPSEVIVSEETTVTETTTTTTTTTSVTSTTAPSDFFEKYVNDGSHEADSPDGRRKPGFKIRPRNKKAPLGGKVDFEVVVTGEPKPDVIWFKNGRRIHLSEDGRVRVEEFSNGGSRLVIEDLEETDHGVYSAEARNELGSERTDEVQLRVTKRTEFSEKSEVRQRGSARVTTRTKKTRHHYTFSEERHGYVTLTLNDAQLEHDGDYRLVVRNKWGEASTQAPLVVIPKVEPRSGYGPSADRSSASLADDSSLDGRSSRARRTPMDELEDYGHELDKSVGMFGSESKYQSGEDTYLLQLRDTEFPLRLRKYLRFGARQSPSLRSNLMDAHWGAGARVTVRERRKFREVMDEEIDDEKAGLDTRPTPLRLQKEVGTCGYSAAALEHLRVEAAERGARKSADRQPIDMMPPFFREKLKDAVVEEHSSSASDSDNVALFACLAAGEPAPEYTWFRNDIIITPDTDRRVTIELRPDGGCELRIREPRLYDAGCFKCVARNVHGDVTTRARLRLATRPSRPEPAECVAASSHQVLLQWKPPRDFDVNCAQVLGYKLELSQSSIGQSDDWTVVAADVGHEFYLVDDLAPATSYSFRLSARNKFGWSDTSYSTYVTTSTRDSAGDAASRLHMPYEQRARQYIADICEPALLRHCEDEKRPAHLSYSIEHDPVKVNGLNGDETWASSGHKLQAEIWRGRFSLIAKAVGAQNQSLAVKIIPAQLQQEAQTKSEFDILRSLQHEKIVQLHMAYRDDDKFVFLMERLSGFDVLTYLSGFSSYNEELVSKILIQVMDAIEYLHFRGMCLLELLPDNVVMSNGRSSSIKLVDFSSARFVPRSGARVPLNVSQNVEYCPPEVAAGHEVNTSSDVWCIGVLAYVLLSGHSPFKGDSGEETRENVLLGRYKYDRLYPNCTPEVTRFLINVFKKHSSKRPTIEQLYENKWLLPNETMIKKRQHATFRTDKILAFAEEFHRNKMEQQAQNQELLSKFMDI